uniref:Uncharacterized protein n=1 Tax=Anguilla anguilla TaxID=7936 RepID=A0A0E9WXI8_ANGAN
MRAVYGGGLGFFRGDLPLLPRSLQFCNMAFYPVNKLADFGEFGWLRGGWGSET